MKQKILEIVTALFDNLKENPPKLEMIPGLPLPIVPILSAVYRTFSNKIENMEEQEISDMLDFAEKLIKSLKPSENQG
jgi:hypothetical protein